MVRTHINFRTWAALVLLGALIIVFALLGDWQLNRAAQRDAIQNQITLAASLPPTTLKPDTSGDDITIWRRAQAQGHWLHRYTVLLVNRNHQGRPGYWVATPLQLSGDNDASTSFTSVLVLRGWLARDDIILNTGDGLPQIDPDLSRKLAQFSDDHMITGQLFAHVPRLFELWSWSDSGHGQLPDQLSDTSHQLPTLQNLDLNDYARATGLKLLPAVLAQTSPELSMVQDWPHPSSDSDTNRGYALQWFSFCAIAAGAWLAVAWGAVKRSRQRQA